MTFKSYLFCGVALALVVAAVRGQTRTEKPGQYIKVEVKGTLAHGLMAIGGETTGTTITAKGITWELDLGKSDSFRASADKLDGKTVVVKGTLEVRKGVEISKRWIVTVSSLKPASGS